MKPGFPQNPKFGTTAASFAPVHCILYYPPTPTAVPHALSAPSTSAASRTSGPRPSNGCSTSTAHVPGRGGALREPAKP